MTWTHISGERQWEPTPRAEMGLLIGWVHRIQIQFWNWIKWRVLGEKGIQRGQICTITLTWGFLTNQTHRHRVEQMRMKADIGGMELEAKESQGLSTASSFSEARTRGTEQILPYSPQHKRSCQHLDFRTVRQEVSVVKATQVVGFVTSALAN